MKRNIATPQTENLIDELESNLANIYGTDFVIDLQEICGQHTLRSVFGEGVSTKIGRDKYANMLRGAWYAANQKKIV
jgi:hypothetical protein